MRISDWSSDVCSSDLHLSLVVCSEKAVCAAAAAAFTCAMAALRAARASPVSIASAIRSISAKLPCERPGRDIDRSEEHTSELQSLMRISYAVFCLKKQKKKQIM